MPGLKKRGAWNKKNAGLRIKKKRGDRNKKRGKSRVKVDSSIISNRSEI